MSFKFGFFDEPATSKPVISSFLDQPFDIQQEYIPRKVDLFDALSDLSRISFSFVETKNTRVPKRDLFDVKHQLMTQDSLSSTEEILLGLTNEDVRKATYEGGLKSWECTYDLMDVLGEKGNDNCLSHFFSSKKSTTSIVELGCGTGLPACYVLQYLLTNNIENVNLILADYNENVLRLVSAPNLLVVWADTLESDILIGLQTSTQDLTHGSITVEAREGELEVTPELLNSFKQDLDKRNIRIELVSGAWSPQFVNLLSPHSTDLVLASETIYSPATIPIFTDTMLNVVRPGGFALIAAKQMYFGVGGGIPEFIEELNQRDTEYKVLKELKKQGVTRAVLRVEGSP